MLVYIASPFFNEEELAFVKAIEKELDYQCIDYFSPRKQGIIKDMTEEEKKDATDNIFNDNINAICECDIMLAVIDNFDPGTIWEMGLAYGRNLPTVSITNKNYGLNVMLAKSVNYHTLNIDQAIKTMEAMLRGDPVVSDTPKIDT